MNENCTVYKTVGYISKKWTLLILLELYKGDSNKKRYSEIKKNMPDISPKILSARLKELQKENMIIRDVDINSFPIKCEYSLTKSGKDFVKIIKDIKNWALKWNINNEMCGGQDCKDCEF
jgi:DNA-binding HxlR family transcriptional regulator